jgi:hypothetical protein
MAVHENIPSMLKESLSEMVLVAKYCIEFRKKKYEWPAEGCYGYPAALLLLSIADSIGSYVIGGNVTSHFKILNNSEYYNLNFSSDELKVIYDKYRNLLSHNTVLARDVALDIGIDSSCILQNKSGIYILNLVPFYNITLSAVKTFLRNPKILENNKMISYISKK